jgi:hypothetical protein
MGKNVSSKAYDAGSKAANAPKSTRRPVGKVTPPKSIAKGGMQKNINPPCATDFSSFNGVGGKVKPTNEY